MRVMSTMFIQADKFNFQKKNVLTFEVDSEMNCITFYFDDSLSSFIWKIYVKESSRLKRGIQTRNEALCAQKHFQNSVDLNTWLQCNATHWCELLFLLSRDKNIWSIFFKLPI